MSIKEKQKIPSEVELYPVEPIKELSGITSTDRVTIDGGEIAPPEATTQEQKSLLSASELLDYRGETYYNLSFMNSIINPTHLYRGIGKVRVQGKGNPSLFDEGLEFKGVKSETGVTSYFLKGTEVRLHNTNKLSDFEQFVIYGLFKVLSSQSISYNNFKEGMFKGLPEEELPKECEDWKGSKGVFIKFTAKHFAEMLGIEGGEKYSKLIGVKNPNPYKRVTERKFIKDADGTEVLLTTVKEIKKSNIELEAEKNGLIVTLGQKTITFPFELQSHTGEQNNYLFVKELSQQLYNWKKITEYVIGKDGKERETEVYYLNLSQPFVYEVTKHYNKITSQEWRFLQENWRNRFCFYLFNILKGLFNFRKGVPYTRLFIEFLRDASVYENFKTKPERVYSDLEEALLNLKECGIISKFEVVFTDGLLVTDTLRDRKVKGRRKCPIEKILIYPPLPEITGDNNKQATLN